MIVPLLAVKLNRSTKEMVTSVEDMNMVDIVSIGRIEMDRWSAALTPHSELLFLIVLNQSTSPSGQRVRRQNIESTVTVSASKMIPAGMPILKRL